MRNVPCLRLGLFVVNLALMGQSSPPATQPTAATEQSRSDQQRLKLSNESDALGAGFRLKDVRVTESGGLTIHLQVVNQSGKAVETAYLLMTVATTNNSGGNSIKSLGRVADGEVVNVVISNEKWTLDAIKSSRIVVSGRPFNP